jgi:hypothetical protein
LKSREIKAGPELDEKIAEAVGWRKQCDFEWTGDSDHENSVYQCKQCGEIVLDDCEPTTQECIPQFSTDLNAAFAAAERVELFDHDHGEQESYLGKTIDGEWEVLVGATGWQGNACGELGYLTREPAPALAICAAILKLKEDES